MLDAGRIALGALAVGIAQAALDASIPYVTGREQFGRPIGTFQAVAFLIADMGTEIEAARQMVWRAARLKDAGQAYGLAAAQAKLFASEMSSRVTNAGIQVHGGYGYIVGLPCRAIPAGRQTHRDRRGNESDTAPRDRARALGLRIH